MKKTNREMFVILLNVVANSEIIETEKAELTDFINSKIEQLDKKANTITKADKAKAELNAKIAQDVITGLTTIGKPIKISGLIKNYEPLNSYSTQKLTPIMTGLINDGKIEKVIVKREALYMIKAN